MIRIVISAAALTLGLSACGSDSPPGYDGLAKYVEGNRTGQDVDHWIELKNIGDEWERTGLIFGYLDDYGECQKAIAGLKQANPAREYRCVPANR